MSARLVRICLSAGCAVAIALTVPGSLDGQGKAPALAGHRFLPTGAAADPFPATFVRTTIGLGQALDLEIIPDFEVGGVPVEGITGDLLFANLNLELGWAIQDWLGVWADVNLLGRLGSDTGSLLSEGVTLLTGFEVGWMFRLVRTERFQLAGTAQIWSDNFTVVSLADWVDGIISGQNVPLVRKAPVVRAGGGVRMAWAITEWLGALGTGELGYGESAAVDPESEWFRTLGAGLSINLGPLWEVPLGFGLGYRLDSFPRLGGSPDRSSKAGTFRIAYTGRDDFLVSLDAGVWRSTLVDGQDLNVVTTGLTMRYFF